MQLEDFKTEKRTEFNELKEQYDFLFPIDLKKIQRDFETIDGDLVTIISENDVTIEMVRDDEMIDVEIDDLNIEDYCYVLDIVRDEAESFAKTMENNQKI